MRPITFGSLFAGIGGFDLGFERAGMVCRWQVEKDEFCQQVLAKHWPNVRRYDDVCTFPPIACGGCGSRSEEGRCIGCLHDFTTTPWAVDVICGGFPCQDISSANHKGTGLTGARSGLWSEYIRIIREIQPKIVCAENVSAITFRGLDRVLWDLARSGFDAEWQTIPAQALGAPHGRDRVFIVAYRASKRRKANEFFNEFFNGRPFETASEKQAARLRGWPGQCEYSPSLPDRIRWCPDSQLCRVADGIPDELDRYRACGNAVVPHVAEWIGHRIVQSLRAIESHS